MHIHPTVNSKIGENSAGSGANGQIVVRNEFAIVAVEVIRNAGGTRLRIKDLRSHVSIELDALELESIAWLRHQDLAPVLDPNATRWQSDDSPHQWIGPTVQPRSGGSDRVSRRAERRRRPRPKGRSRYTTSDGVRIHYLDYKGSGRDLLLVPGLSCPAASYETVSLALNRVGFRVACIDLRGRGLSDKPASGFTLADYSRDLKAVADAAALTRPVIVGHALGARVVAAYDVLFPGEAALLVIADPPATGPGHPPYATPLASFQRQLAEAREGITVDDVRQYFPDWDEEALELRARWLDTCDPHAIEESYRNFVREDFFGYMARIRTPALFVHGETSYAVPPAALAEIRESNQSLEIVEIPGVGHMIPFEDRDAFVEVIRSFVERAAVPPPA